jgi:hypothetical protein
MTIVKSFAAVRVEKSQGSCHGMAAMVNDSGNIVRGGMKFRPSPPGSGAKLVSLKYPKIFRNIVQADLEINLVNWNSPLGVVLSIVESLTHPLTPELFFKTFW